MAYELLSNQSVAGNIGRIWSEELTAAIETLQNAGNNPDKAVHEVRKGMKKIRALLRLVRKSMGKELFARENVRYRNIGHMLSQVRDSAVMIKTLGKLKQANPRAMPATAYKNTLHKLSEKKAEAARSFFENNQSIPAVLSALKQAKEGQPEVPVSKESFAVFGDNIRKIYERGIQAYKHAGKQPSIDNFHELRKEVKILWYHTRLLRPVWPGFMEAYASQLGTLSELLGDDHDMGVLYEQIASGSLTFSRKATAAKMQTLIEDYRNTLQQQIHPLAKRVFAEEPEAFTGRLKRYWNIWRKEAAPEQTA
jgi:CHAD domain-containing protein